MSVTTESELSAFSRAATPSSHRAAAVPRPARRWKTRVGVPLAILLSAGALMAYAAREALWPGVPVRVVPVVVKADAEAPMAAGEVVTQAPGWVEPDPYPTAVSALTDGIVQDVLVLEGQRVATGQVVARLVPDDARLALVKAEADLSFKRATRDAAKATWDNPVERDRAIAATQAQLDEAGAELKRLPSDLEAQRARAQDAQVEYQTMTEAPPSTVSRLDAAKAKYKADEEAATLRSLEAKRASLEAKVQQYAAELKAARDNRRLRIEEARALAEGESAVKLSEAAVAEARLRVDRLDVRSPVDGVVMERMVEPGSKVMFASDMAHSAHVLRLYDPRRLQVRVDVPLADAAKVRLGQAARVTVDVLPDRTFDGEVTRVVSQADVQKNTQQFKVAIKEPAEALTPEMLAKVKFFGMATTGSTATTAPSNNANVVFAPGSLIHTDATGAWALTLDARDHRAVRRALTVGAAAARPSGWVAVSQGLSPGDRLIVSDTPLTDGARVRVTGEASDEELHLKPDEPVAVTPTKGGDHAHH